MLDYIKRLSLNNDGILFDDVSGRKLALNETGQIFWRILERTDDFSAALEEVTRYFDADPEVLRSDLENFVSVLDKDGLCDGAILPGGKHFVLEPTAACNGGCPHCYHGHHGDKWPKENENKAILALKKSGARSVSITGGEVFSAHFVDRLFPLVADLKASEISVASISTNATFITEDVGARIIREIPSSTVFRISLDALRGDLLDRIRPGYHKLENPYGPISDLDKSGYPLVFTTNIYSQTPEDIREIGDFLRRFKNIKSWNVRLAVPVHFGTGERVRSASRKSRLFKSRPEFDRATGCFEEIISEHSRKPYQFDVRMGNYLSTKLLENPHGLTEMTDDHPCREDKSLTTFKASGEVTQCPILSELDKEMNSGNIFDADTKSTFTTPVLSKLSVTEMGCNDCYLRSVCGGGCRLYALAYDQGLEGCDLSARSMIEWMLADPSGLIREHWPEFFSRLHHLTPRPH